MCKFIFIVDDIPEEFVNDLNTIRTLSNWVNE